MGEPRHRGIDVLAVETDETQTVAGKFAYSASDKDLEDEDIDVFGCVGGTWRALGAARTNGQGRFDVDLHGGARLPVGQHELYARARGDGSGVRFYGYVLRADEAVLVTDIDGTITATEHACISQIVLGTNIGHQPGAPEALAAAQATHGTVVYLTARGDQFTELTRRWLDDHGFPRGPLRLAPRMLVRPGAPQLAAKRALLASLRAPIAAAIGNRGTDIRAYSEVGLSPAQILINVPEFADEVREDVLAGRVTAFDHYSDLTSVLP